MISDRSYDNVRYRVATLHASLHVHPTQNAKDTTGHAARAHLRGDARHAREMSRAGRAEAGRFGRGAGRVGMCAVCPETPHRARELEIRLRAAAHLARADRAQVAQLGAERRPRLSASACPGGALLRHGGARRVRRANLRRHQGHVRDVRGKGRRARGGLGGRRRGVLPEAARRRWGGRGVGRGRGLSAIAR